MAKGAIAMLVKLKCMIRIWRNHSKIKSTIPTAQLLLSPPPPSTGDLHTTNCCKVRPVYVGRSRRLYQLSPHLVEHPLFRVLVQKSGGTTSINEAEVVDCEVVLFEHFLWMLENNYDEIKQPELLDEIVGFYTLN